MKGSVYTMYVGKSKLHYGYYIVLACIFVMIAPVALVLSCIGIYYPYMAETLEVGKGALSYYMTFLWIAAIIALPLAGRLIGTKDVRWCVSVGVLIVACTMFAQSFVTVVWQFYVCGFIMGLGIPMLLFLTVPTLINRWFKKQAGFLVGLCMAFTAIGGVLWNPVCGWIINAYGWAICFRAMSIVALVLSLPFTVFVLRSYPSSLGLLPYGDEGIQDQDGEVVATQERGLGASRTYKTVSFVLILVFVLIININMYANQMTASYVSTLDIADKVPMFVSVSAAFVMAGQFFGKIFLGLVADRAPRFGYTVALVGGIAGIVGYNVFPQAMYLLIVSGFLLGMFCAITNVLMPAITRKLFGMRDYSQIYSRISMVACIGSATQALIWGTIIDATGGFTIMFIGIAGLMAIALVVATIAMKLGEKLPEQFERSAPQTIKLEKTKSAVYES